MKQIILVKSLQDSQAELIFEYLETWSKPKTIIVTLGEHISLVQCRVLV